MAKAFGRTLAAFAVGLGLGLAAPYVVYSYGHSDKGLEYRVNRWTGVQQFASSKGWVSEAELFQNTFQSVFGGMGKGIRETFQQPHSHDANEVVK